MSEIVEWRPPEGLRAVIAGEGCVAARLGGELAATGARTPMILCGQNLAASPLLERTRAAAGRAVPLWDGSLPHTPIEAVASGFAAARDAGADALIALGGSSTSDCAKAIAVLLASGARSATELQPIDWAKMAAPMADSGRRAMPLLVLPTTLSAAEFQTFFGIRQDGRKQPYSERNLVRRTVFLDGELAAQTPAAVWTQTAIKLLDDMLYRYCTADGTDGAQDVVLEQCLGTLFADLPLSLQSADPAPRQRLLRAMWLSNVPLPAARPAGRRPWLSMVARHAIGGATGLAHGIGSCVALVKALHFHAETSGGRQARLAARLGRSGSLADAVEWLLRDVAAPVQLGPLGVGQEAIGQILANMAFESPELGGEDRLRPVVESFW